MQRRHNMKPQLTNCSILLKTAPAVSTLSPALLISFRKHGFTELMENNIWKNWKKGKSYFVRRNDSAIIAFKIPENDFKNFQIIASHSDSPTFKLKENPEMKTAGHYTKLNVERYGGMICSPWFDRPLSIAGKVMVRQGNQFTSRLINLDQDLVMIVNLRHPHEPQYQ